MTVGEKIYLYTRFFDFFYGKSCLRRVAFTSTDKFLVLTKMIALYINITFWEVEKAVGKGETKKFPPQKPRRF